jgi:hypothetical protein
MSLINTADPLYSSLGRNQGDLFLCNSQATTGHYSTFTEEYQSPISLEYGLDYVSVHPPVNQRGAEYAKPNAHLPRFLHTQDCYRQTTPVASVTLGSSQRA